MQNKTFAAVLTASLREHYNGRLPAFATIARDFALHSPEGLAPISAETPRKWIRGQSLPSLERLHTLAHWLGPEILGPLNGKFIENPIANEKPKTSLASEVADVTELLKQLTPEELDTVAQLLHHLVGAHMKHRGNEQG